MTHKHTKLTNEMLKIWRKTGRGSACMYKRSIQMTLILLIFNRREKMWPVNKEHVNEIIKEKKK